MRRTTAVALMLTMLPAVAAAQQADARPPRSVTVNAYATVQRQPDRAVLMLAVESQAEGAQDAARANAELMTRVIAAVQRAGIPEERIRTVSYDLQPIYSQPPREPQPMQEYRPQIIGYRAMNMVRVEVDDVDGTGRVIDAALEAGANRVDGISFELRDGDSAYNEALGLAVEKARAQAAAAARAAGQQLGQPLSIQVGGAMPVPPPAPPMYRSMDMVQAAATPIQSGSLEIGASVTITWELIGG